jgi:hypothetical protein
MKSFDNPIRPTLYPLLSLALILLSGCSPKINCAGFSHSNSKPTMSAVEGTIRVSVDGSGSMKGFTIPNGSEFHTTLEEMDSILGVKGALGIMKSKTEIFRLGRTPDGKTSQIVMKSLLAARSARFFDGSNTSWPAVTSSIDQFATPSKSSIDILLSDLEPDDAAIKQLISSIKPKLTATNTKSSWWQSRNIQDVPTQLVLLGIKSQFDGGVFPSVAGQFQSFPYNGIRPFYLLILGETSKVEMIVSQVLNIPELSGKTQVTRFASNPNHGYTSFANNNATELNPPSCLMPVLTLSQGMSGKIRLDHADRWILAKAIPTCSNNNKSILFKNSVDLGFKLERTGRTPIFANSTQVSDFTISENGFGVNIKPMLQQNALNFIDISLDASEVDSVIWNDWSSISSNPVGSKTQRLMQLIRRLREETNNHALSGFGKAYSPMRLCSVIRS